jgi:hypothetical protein
MRTLTAPDIAWYMRCAMREQRHQWITPNAMLYAWESDLLSVDPDGSVHEVEIKCTRADLKQDLKKPKHSQGMLQHGSFLVKPAGLARSWGEEVEEARRLNGAVQCRRPNFFSFAMPCRVFRLNPPIQLPAYAGVYTVDEQGRIKEERSPKPLHRKRIASKDLLALARRIHHRYWNELRRARHAPESLLEDREGVFRK